MRQRSKALLAAALGLALSAAPVSAGGMAVGYNQAWFKGDYGSDLTSRFDPIHVDLLFHKMALGGAYVVRMWIFEGARKEGLLFTERTRTRGLVPGFTDNIERVCESARRHGLKIYWTVFDGNWFWDRHGFEAHVHYNILNNRWAEGDSFNHNALAPVLDVLARHADTVFALDLMNEVQGSLAHWFWPDGWLGARRWIARTAAFVKARAPWLRVTASAGWHTGPFDLTAGMYGGLGLDFFDLHVYDDDGRIPLAFPLRVLCWVSGRQIVLGEFGQRTKRVDDAMQARATARFIAAARSLGFAGALGWRFDDERPWDPAFVPYLSYLRNGQPRPAVAEVARAAAEPWATADPWRP